MSGFLEYKDTKPAILIKAALDVIIEPGSTFEIRIPKTLRGTYSAYFQDTAIAASLVARENGKHQAIYVTVNPVKSELLARNANRFEIGTPTTTNDSEIARRRWFLLDFDPIRVAGISSTDAELAASKDAAANVIEYLRSMGWPEPVQALSGNGYHVIYRVDLENDNDSRVNIEFALKMLSSIFSDERVNLDTTVFNAARVWKVYGTVSQKGSNTPERPHRVAKFVDVPRSLGIVSLEMLETIGRPLRDAKSDEFRDMAGEFISDMVRWLADRGQTVVSGPRPLYGNEGQKWLISRCPFNGQHTSPVVGLVGNRPIFRCLHNSCSAFRWKEFREKIDPTYKDPETVYNRILEWANSDSAEPDAELIQTACALGKRLPPLLIKARKECSRARVVLFEDFARTERRRFQREVLGNENGEKGNIVGLINRVRNWQSDGNCPMYWMAEHDQRIRVGPVGEHDCGRVGATEEVALLLKFHGCGDIWVKQGHCAQVILTLAEEYRVNPMRQMLKLLKWDGLPRLDMWLNRYLGCKNSPYTQAIGRKWMISAVARSLDPGCQADHMLILEGPQGIGKSQALRILGGHFYVEYSGALRGNANAHKDMVHTILGKQIVEMSELATLKRADIEMLKSLLTTTVDEVRLSYERDSRGYPRTCVFAGTTNEVRQTYIADYSGARRFWPTVAGEVGPLKIELLRADRDQLWAEAIEAFEAGENWWQVPVEEALLEQQDRQVTVEASEPWFPKLVASLTNPDSYSAGLFHIRPEYLEGQVNGDRHIVRAGNLSEILAIVIGVESARQSTIDIGRVQRVFRQIGFKKVRPSKGWCGGTYAYDIDEDAISHLWVGIKAAARAAIFKKPGTEAPGENPDPPSLNEGQEPRNQ